MRKDTIKARLLNVDAALDHANKLMAVKGPEKMIIGELHGAITDLAAAVAELAIEVFTEET